VETHPAFNLSRWPCHESTAGPYALLRRIVSPSFGAVVFSVPSITEYKGATPREDLAPMRGLIFLDEMAPCTFGY
jgi:hypothetical protein